MIVKKGPNGGSWAMVTLVGYGYARGNNHSRRPPPTEYLQACKFPRWGHSSVGRVASRRTCRDETRIGASNPWNRHASLDQMLSELPRRSHKKA